MERPLTLRFVAQATLVVIALWALANLAWAARDILFVAFFAVLVASFLTILIDPLVDLGGDRHEDAARHRARYPEGVVGADPALARPEHGAAFLEAAAEDVAETFLAFESAPERGHS